MTKLITDPRTSSTSLFRLGPGSLLLASAALVAASIPYVRVLALPLSALGIVVGVIALMSNSKSSTNYRKSEMGLPLAGGIASVVVFLLAGFWLGQFELILHSWRKAPVLEQKTVPLRSQANPAHGDQSQIDWVDASQDAVQVGDVRVRLVGGGRDRAQRRSRQAALPRLPQVLPDHSASVSRGADRRSGAISALLGLHHRP